MSERVLILHGKRQGRTLSNEQAFHKALEDGKRVFTGGPTLNGVWFEVTLGDGGAIVYTALEQRPEGI